ncbi:hypothetical protein [Aquincola sp. J276]|uniref:hypothetical protein n=1 Tax=Aquincola sp. J276 TaxID=2898432 RepID=UPI002151472D|nr:hypothetical protein [Aquincola sp. J276]MCR5869265.1 phosphotransferase [Aquincola sp. J276]
MSAETLRQQAQLAFLASGAQIEVGRQDDLPLPLAVLRTTTADSPHVRQVFHGGLTATVYQLEAGGRLWALKRQRPESLVRNVDGQTAFLNEVQRRAELHALRHDPALRHVVPTQYASLHDGLILSPWIDGAPPRRFGPRLYRQLFGTLAALELHGFFEWDLCPGNLLDDGTQLMLFDFGYMYRFDPLRQFNNNGLATPMFHGVERFETRCFFGHLLTNPDGLDEAGLLAAYREEKACALQYARHKLQRLEQAGASAPVLQWHQALAQRWEQALAGSAALQRLYLLESFRSFVIDLLDDLHGRSCTPATLHKADAVLDLLQQHAPLLREAGGLFFGDEALDDAALLQRYRGLRAQAQQWQLPTG